MSHGCPSSLRRWRQKPTPAGRNASHQVSDGTQPAYVLPFFFCWRGQWTVRIQFGHVGLKWQNLIFGQLVRRMISIPFILKMICFGPNETGRERERVFNCWIYFRWPDLIGVEIQRGWLKIRNEIGLNCVLQTFVWAYFKMVWYICLNWSSGQLSIV